VRFFSDCQGMGSLKVAPAGANQFLPCARSVTATFACQPWLLPQGCLQGTVVQALHATSKPLTVVTTSSLAGLACALVARCKLPVVKRHGSHGSHGARAWKRVTALQATPAEVQQRLEDLRAMRLRDLKRELQAMGCRTEGCMDKESLMELLETQGAAAIAQGKGRSDPEGNGAVPRSGNPVATFETTMGTFTAEIFLEEMPLTASNFIALAREGFYNGIHFHRVIPGFMAQFGCPYARDPKSPRAGSGGPEDGTTFRCTGGKFDGQDISRINGGCIPDEFAARISNAPGTLSMANTGRPNSGGSQFFINVGNNANLDWFSPGTSKHPVFGKVVEGFHVVQRIVTTPTRNENPLEPVMMRTITVV